MHATVLLLVLLTIVAVTRQARQVQVMQDAPPRESKDTSQSRELQARFNCFGVLLKSQSIIHVPGPLNSMAALLLAFATVTRPKAKSLGSQLVMSAAGKLPVMPHNALRFFKMVGKLKTLKRTGWVNNNIVLPESVADHSYRMSMLAFAIVDPEVDRDKLVKICLVHDLAEAVAGDITPYDGVTKEQKRALEEQALDTILDELHQDTVAAELRELWLEYEHGTCKEAVVAKQLDKFEMIVQANEYELAHPGKRLDSFFESTQDSFKHPEVLSWAQELRAEREKRLADDSGSS